MLEPGAINCISLAILRIALINAFEPSTMNSRQTFGSSPRSDQIVEQRLHHGSVLGRSLQ